ncbi:transcriptional regulator [Bradyrhizobium sp. Ce-3]|nr:transcriptional regulator [Bradyrhizobium sp. Ce-3]
MRRLGEAVVDPLLWPELMESICAAVGGSAALLLQSDVRTPDVPRTKSIDEATRFYFANDWHTKDPRAIGFPRMMAGEVVTDQDLLTPEQIQADPMYNEVLFPFGFKWFAGIGFWADTAAWALTIQRTQNEEPFDEADKRALARLAPRLTETATLATAVGRVALTSMTNVLEKVQRPAVVLNRQGFVLSCNAAADAGFDQDILVRNRRLALRDKDAMAKYHRLVDLIRTSPDGAALPTEPIVVRRAAKPPVLIRVLLVDGAASSVFLGARAMLVFSNLSPPPLLDAKLIARAFDLTPAEARLTALLRGGLPIQAAAEQLEISPATARNHLKSVFFKTSTHRQSELIRLVTMLG